MLDKLFSKSPSERVMLRRAAAEVRARLLSRRVLSADELQREFAVPANRVIEAHQFLDALGKVVGVPSGSLRSGETLAKLLTGRVVNGSDTRDLQPFAYDILEFLQDDYLDNEADRDKVWDRLERLFSSTPGSEEELLDRLHELTLGQLVAAVCDYAVTPKLGGAA